MDLLVGRVAAARTGPVFAVWRPFSARPACFGKICAALGRDPAACAGLNKQRQAAAPLFLGRSGVPRLISELEWSVSVAAP